MNLLRKAVGMVLIGIPALLVGAWCLLWMLLLRGPTRFNAFLDASNKAMDGLIADIKSNPLFAKPAKGR